MYSKMAFSTHACEGCDKSFKVGLSPSKIFLFYLLQWKPFKMMKNAFYFILKGFFVLKIINVFLRLFGHVEKTA